MYVRWQWRYQQRRGSSEQSFRSNRRPANAHAVLVESYRVDGKPKQRHIAYLGSFHKPKRPIASLGGVRLKQDVHYRAWWWHDMTAKLDALGNRIPADDRPRIEAALAAKVPNDITAEEVAAFDRKHQDEMRAELGECRGCYLDWPEGLAGVPPRPVFPETTERWADTLAAVAEQESE